MNTFMSPEFFRRIDRRTIRASVIVLKCPRRRGRLGVPSASPSSDAKFVASARNLTHDSQISVQILIDTHRCGHYNVVINMKELRRTMAQQGPGRHHREGLSLVQITRMFPDDATAEAWFAQTRWPNGPVCPHCGSIRVQSGAAHRTMPYRCRDCRRRFSVKTDTVMANSKLGCQTWAIAIYLLTTGIKGVSSMKLHRDLGITQRSAWHLAHRIRETWGRSLSAFEGPVEADETYIGGLRRNMHRRQREALTGRGAVGKAAVAGVRDRASGRVSAAVVAATDGATLHPFVASRTEPSAQVYTDDHRGYRNLPRRHRTVRHSVGEYVDGMAHTNGLESFWSLLKRGYHGTYHRMSQKHHDRYVNEFSGRFNDRDNDTLPQMAAMARGLQGKRLPYRDLVR